MLSCAHAACAPLACLCAPTGPSVSAHGVHAPDSSALHSIGVGDAGLAPAADTLESLPMYIMSHVSLAEQALSSLYHLYMH
jgi:hypothetical protein